MTAAMVLPATMLHVVAPADLHDPQRPSGGNLYGRRVLERLPGAGRAVRLLSADGNWPDPDAQDRAALDLLLANVPDGADVLLDGLVACGVPEVVVPHARRLRLAVLVHLPLGDEAGLDPQWAGVLTRAEGEVLRAASAVVATSMWTAGRLAEVHGLHIDEVRVAPPGVDPAPLAEQGDGGRLLSVGSLTPTKGHDVLVRALARITDLHWTWRLVGPGSRSPGHERLVRSLAAQYGLAERVVLTGPRTGTELDAEYAAADLLVQPSRQESYGMVVTEALARGIPVLATTVGGMPDAIGVTRRGAHPGFLVPPDDPEALASALRRWLTEPAVRESTRHAARRRRPALHGWDVTARCLAQVLA